MSDFLLELLSEEIPARMQAKACADLERLFAEQLAAAGLKVERIETFVTPRRLALIARGLPRETAASSEERKGPSASAPAQAIEGFLRATGLTRDQLVEREDKKGVTLFALIEKPGRATAELLAEAIPAIVRAFPWPKSMRWGTASESTEALRWVRPLQGIIALLGDQIVPFEIAGIASGAATVGHRFHHPGMITIGNADDYAAKLRACHVILDAAERRQIIADGARAAASAAGLTLVEDEGLIAENAGLTEWPVPLLGHFDPAFLDVPREVIQLTMRTNQKYFACTQADGSLAPAFVCTANIEANDGGVAIVAGNEKVLAARLSDAKFFWEHDLQIPLADQAKKLDQIVFHEKLGTVADKVDRVAKLARWLVEEGVVGSNPTLSATPRHSRESGNPASPSTAESGTPASAGVTQRELADMAETAARLAKADLVTGMVGEFPELQGVIGGYLARAQGQPQAVAEAIRDHYKPVGQGDDVPTAPVTVAVSLADKLDSLGQFFAVDLKPTGSKDPFALRRAGLGVLRLIRDNGLRFDVSTAIGAQSVDQSAAADLNVFFVERLQQMLRDEGVQHDVVSACVPEGNVGFDVGLAAAASLALQHLIDQQDGKDLLAGYKRASNILKKENYANGSGPQPLSYTPEAEEAALIAALDAEEPKAAEAIEAEDFEGAMAALASLRVPVDAFFDKVTVNDADPAKREARLALLARVRDAVHRVADFSKIEG